MEPHGIVFNPEIWNCLKSHI